MAPSERGTSSLLGPLDECLVPTRRSTAGGVKDLELHLHDVSDLVRPTREVAVVAAPEPLDSAVGFLNVVHGQAQVQHLVQVEGHPDHVVRSKQPVRFCRSRRMSSRLGSKSPP